MAQIPNLKYRVNFKQGSLWVEGPVFETLAETEQFLADYKTDFDSYKVVSVFPRPKKEGV